LVTIRATPAEAKHGGGRRFAAPGAHLAVRTLYR
jgi:hypothetical protein